LIADLGMPCAAVGARKIDLERDVVQLIWVDTDALKKDNVVYHALIQKDDAEPFGATLPGIAAPRRAFEIFVSSRDKDAIASTYASTRQRDPLEEQLPDFAKAIFEPLVTLLASTQATLRGRALPASVTAATHYATVSQVMLPFARAAIHVEVRVAVAPGVASIQGDVQRLFERNAFITGAHSECARSLNEKLKTEVHNQAVICSGSPGGCVPAVTEKFNAEFKNTVGSCGSEADRKELMAVDTSYREFVTGLTAVTVSGAFDLKNSPRRLVSLGVASAYAFRGGVVNATRVKLDDGNIVADPLDRRMSLVVVNFGFKPYAFSPTNAERYRWVVGAVVTPDFGVAAGVSASIVRGLAVNFGGAIIGVRGKHDDDQIGSPPTHGEDPFRLSAARVLFLGLGYNFK
jgi:hypothetical protein